MISKLRFTLSVVLVATALALATAFPVGTALARTAMATNNSNPSRGSAEPDSSWQTISPKSGRYSISMLGTIKRTEQEVGPHKTVTFMSSAQEGKCNFMLQHTTYSADYLSKRSRTRLLAEAMHQTVSTMIGKVTNKNYIDVDGHEALEFDFEAFPRDQTHATESASRTLHGRGRIIWADDTEYILVCDRAGAQLGPECDKFFGSFRFVR
jgi:hypothetical protein